MFNLAHALKLIKSNDIDILFLYDANYINYAALPSKVAFNVSPISLGVNNLWINISNLSDDLVVGTSEELIVIYNITDKRVVKAINNGEYVDRLLCVNNFDDYSKSYEEGYFSAYRETWNKYTPEQCDYPRGKIRGQGAAYLGTKKKTDFSGKSEAYKRGYLDGYQKRTKNISISFRN